MAGSATIAEPVERFGSLMKFVRERRGLSIKKVSALVDGEISPPSVSRLENGVRDPQLRSLVALARAYDVDIIVTRIGKVEVRGTGLRVDPSRDAPPKEVPGS